MHLCGPCHIYEKQWPEGSFVVEEVHSYLCLGHVQWKSNDGIRVKICKLFCNCSVRRAVYVGGLQKPRLLSVSVR